MSSQKLEKVKIAESVLDQLRADLEVERRSVERLNGGIKLARDHDDNGSAELLTDLLGPAEAHVGWLESQLDLVKQLGDAHYLAQQVKKGQAARGLPAFCSPPLPREAAWRPPPALRARPEHTAPCIPLA